MGVQLSYSTSQPAAYAGLLASSSMASSIRSAINADPQTNGIPFGLALAAGAAPAQGAVDRKVVLPTSADAEMLGIGVHTHAVNNIGLTGSNGMPTLGQISLLEMGDVWVKVEEAVLADDPVFVRFTSDGGSNTQIGGFRKSIDSGRAVRLKGAKYIMPAAAGGYAIVKYLKSGAAGEGLLSIRQDFVTFSASTTDYLFTTPADRYFKLVSASLYVPVTGVTLDAGNFFALQLQGHTGPIDLANYSTGVTAITAATLTAMTLSTTVIPPSTVVELAATLTGTKTMPAGSLILTGYYL